MAATIYLATTANGGSDSNDGLTTGTPKATFRQAIFAVDDGGTIEVIDSATHSPSDSFDNRAIVNKSVNVVVSDGETPTLDGTAAFIAGRPGFASAGTYTLTFTGFTFENWGASTTSYIVSQTGNLTLQYSQCVFKSIGDVSLFQQPPVATRDTPNKLDRCRIESTVESRIFSSVPGSDWYFLVENCLFEYNGTHSGEVYIDSNNDSHINAIVRNCSFLVELNDTTGTSNGVIRCGTVENTIIKNTSTGGSYTTLAAIKAKSAYSNNCVDGNFAVAEVSTGGTDGGGLVREDPLFTNEASSPADFELQSGSPCIDAGKTIAAVTVDFAGTSRPQGSAYDIGAYETIAGGGSFTPDDGEETYGVKFSSSFTIRGTANKLATRRFASDKDNRQAPFSVTVSGPATIRRRSTPYKSET
jgi:hypothetical protein